MVAILRKDFPMPFGLGLELGLQKWLSHNTIASLQSEFPLLSVDGYY